MATGEIDEHLARLCQAELAAGPEGLAEAIADLSRSELERLLRVAVVALMDAENRVDREAARLARRLQERRSGDS